MSSQRRYRAPDDLPYIVVWSRGFIHLRRVEERILPGKGGRRVRIVTPSEQMKGLPACPPGLAERVRQSVKENTA